MRQALAAGLAELPGFAAGFVGVRTAAPPSSTGFCAEAETQVGPGPMYRRLQAVAYEKCIPLNVTFEITLRCNIRCHHCYNLDRSQTYGKGAARKELGRSEVLRIIDEVTDAGSLYLNFTGGEALLHPHLREFVARARERHAAVKLKSNGTLLTPAKAKEIASAGAYGVDISLYGASEESYRALTRVPGTYAKTLSGIEAALGATLKVRLSLCLLQTNAHEMGRMIEFARSRELPFNVDPQITARYDGTKGSADLRVDRETLDGLYRGVLRDVIDLRESSYEQAPQCSCARSTCGISAFGEVYPCIGAPMASGNLREKCFAEIWSGSPELNRIRGLALDDFPSCKPCPYRPNCHRSSGISHTNAGEYTGPEEWTCMEAGVLRDISIERKRETSAPAAGEVLSRDRDDLRNDTLL